MAKSLVFVGGGHAHLYSLQRATQLARAGCTVTLVSPERFQYYSGMGPGLLGGTYTPEEARFDLRRLCEQGGVAFVEDAVAAVDPGERRLALSGGGSLAYDLASFNTGSKVADGSIPGAAVYAVPVKPIHNLFQVRDAILGGGGAEPLRLAVIGGGPAGVEVTANIWKLAHENAKPVEVALLEGAARLLPGMSAAAAGVARRSLEERGIDVRLAVRVGGVVEGGVALEGGEVIAADLVVLCTGTTPGGLFRAAGLTEGEDPGLAVDKTLRHRTHREIYAVGDCAAHPHHPLARVGVYAVRQAPILFGNLMAALTGEAPRRFAPQRRYLLILNLGDQTGLVEWGRWVVRGRWAFGWKKYLDTMFMRRFQPERRGGR